MLVDDDEMIRHSLAEILRMEGYDVLTVSTAEAALAHLAIGVRPSVVILDLWLPGIGSAELARRLRSQFSPPVPVAVLTAWPSGERLGLEADALLTKPSEGTTVVRAIDRLVAASAAKQALRRAQQSTARVRLTRSRAGRRLR